MCCAEGKAAAEEEQRRKAEEESRRNEEELLRELEEEDRKKAEQRMAQEEKKRRKGKGAAKNAKLEEERAAREKAEQEEAAKVLPSPKSLQLFGCNCCAGCPHQLLSSGSRPCWHDTQGSWGYSPCYPATKDKLLDNLQGIDRNIGVGNAMLLLKAGCTL